MKRRTLLAVLIPLVAVVIVCSAVGFHVSGKLPTTAQVEDAATQAEAKSYRTAAEKWDDFISLAFEVSSLAVLCIAVVILLHVSTFPRVKAWRERVFGAGSPGARERKFVAAALVIGFALAALGLINASASNLVPKGDEISYLEEALDVKTRYGVAGFGAALYSGEWSEHNRHPLYIWTLVPFMLESPETFLRAKRVSAVLAMASVFVVFVVTWRLFGAVPGVLAVLLYSVNPSFLKLASEVKCEPLLVSCVMASFYFTVRGLRNGPLLIWAGAFAGLAYMTKTNGLFLPVAFFAVALALWRFAAFRRKHFYLYFAAFAIAASPLLCRNVIRYGNPFSNYNNRLLWLDKRAQTDTPRFIEGRTGMREYIARRGVFSIAVLFAEGGEAALENAVLTVSPVRKMLYMPPGSRKYYKIHHGIGISMLVVMLFFLVMDVEPGRRLFAGALCAILWLSTAWYYKIDMGPRFVLPFMPVMLAYVAAGVTGLVRGWPVRPIVLLIATLACIGLTASRLSDLSFNRMSPPLPEARIVARWLDENLAPGDTYLMDDDHIRFGWFHRRKGRSEGIPNTESVELLVEAARTRRARFLIISRGVFEMRHLQFSGAFGFRNNNLTATRPIAGLKEVFVDTVSPVDFIIYEVIYEDTDSQEGRKADG